jgi:polyhydroxyalkanoate synthesis regulator phasin
MDDQKVTDSLKKILMAGFGAVSSGVEKSQEILDNLAEKGESAYQQAVAAGKETADKLKKAYDESGIKELFDKGISFRKEDLLTMAETLPVEDILWLQSQLTALAVKKAAEQPAEEEKSEEPKTEL